MKKSWVRLSAVLPFAAGGVLLLVSGCSPMGGVPIVPPGSYIPDPPEVETKVPEKTVPEVKDGAGLQGGSDTGIPTNPDIIYVARTGDTLQSIGRVYGIGANDLAIINNLPADKQLTPGTQVRIPADMISTKNARPAQQVKYTGPVKPQGKPQGKKPEAKPEVKSAQPAGEKIHIVKSGDMLSKLAIQYHVYASEIARANNIELNSRLKIGQKLVIPATTKKGTALPKTGKGKTSAKPAAGDHKAKPEAKPVSEPKAKPEVKPVPEVKPEAEGDDHLFDTEPAATPVTTPKPEAAAPQPETAAAAVDLMDFTTDQDTTVILVSELIDCPVETLLKYNSALTRDSAIPAKTTIKIPILTKQ